MYFLSFLVSLLVPCHVSSRRAMSCLLASCHVPSSRVMSSAVMRSHVMSSLLVLCRIMPCHVLSCYVMSRYVLTRQSCHLSGQVPSCRLFGGICHISGIVKFLVLWLLCHVLPCHVTACHLRSSYIYVCCGFLVLATRTKVRFVFDPAS